MNPRIATFIIATTLAVSALAKVAIRPPAATQPATLPATTTVAGTTQAATTRAAGVAVVAAQPAQAAIRVNRAIAVPIIKQQRDNARTSVKSMADGGTYKMTDLLRVTLVDGKLQPEWTGKMANGQSKRIKIEGSDAQWVVNQFNNGQSAYHNLVRYDFDAPEDEYWMVTFNFQPLNNTVSISAQGGEMMEANRMNFYQQNNNTVTFNLSGYENNRFRQILNVASQDIPRLRADRPDEVRRYLATALRKITLSPVLSPGPSDVYKVFTQIAADPKVTAKIEGLFPGLTSTNPAEREAATKTLNAMGPAGALAAMRMDFDLLLPEQVTRLQQMIAIHTRMGVDDPKAALADPMFLLDCFEDEDVRIRTAAKEAIEKSMSKKVEIDASAPLDKWAAQADKLRRDIMKERAKDAPKAEAAPAGGPAVQVQLVEPAVQIKMR